VQYWYVKTMCNRCSDGYVKYTEGEECDDGNLIYGDGCDSRCMIEEPFKCMPSR